MNRSFRVDFQANQLNILKTNNNKLRPRFLIQIDPLINCQMREKPVGMSALSNVLKKALFLATNNLAVQTHLQFANDNTETSYVRFPKDETLKNEKQF